MTAPSALDFAVGAGGSLRQTSSAATPTLLRTATITTGMSLRAGWNARCGRQPVPARRLNITPHELGSPFLGMNRTVRNHSTLVANRRVCEPANCCRAPTLYCITHCCACFDHGGQPCLHALQETDSGQHLPERRDACSVKPRPRYLFRLSAAALVRGRG